MLFNIEVDCGDEIIGYLVPDSFSEVPRLCVIGHGRVLWSGPATERRDALVASGRHETGLCGFRIGPSDVSDLASLVELEIRDLGSGLTIYRRERSEGRKRGRVFRLETRLSARRRLDLAMEPHFQGWYPQLERFGHETVAQVFLLANISSSYASGRLPVQAHPELTDGRVRIVAELRDPFEELAERLLVLSGRVGPVAQYLTLRDRLMFHNALEMLYGADVSSRRGLSRTFGRLAREEGATLSNPLTRQLTCQDLASLCAPSAVAAALRTIAGFDLVTVSEFHGFFETALGEILRLPAPTPAPVDERCTELADRLSRIGAAEALLECDLEVYASASAVFESAAEGAIDV